MMFLYLQGWEKVSLTHQVSDSLPTYINRFVPAKKLHTLSLSLLTCYMTFHNMLSQSIF